jgi:hypothetical protein
MDGVNIYAKGVCNIGPVAEVVKWCKDVMHEVRAKTKVRDGFNQAQKLPQFADFRRGANFRLFTGLPTLSWQKTVTATWNKNRTVTATCRTEEKSRECGGSDGS